MTRVQMFCMRWFRLLFCRENKVTSSHAKIHKTQEIGPDFWKSYGVMDLMDDEKPHLFYVALHAHLQFIIVAYNCYCGL